MLYRNWFELEACLRMSPLKWDISQPSKIFMARYIHSGTSKPYRREKALGKPSASL